MWILAAVVLTLMIWVTLAIPCLLTRYLMRLSNNVILGGTLAIAIAATAALL